MINFNKIKWEKNYENNRFFLKWLDEMVVRFMANYMTIPHGNVLDLGCGSGRHSELFAENGFNVYGCDVSSKSILMTKKRLKKFNLRKKFATAYSWDLPYNNDFFNYVLGWHSIYYNDFIQLKTTIKEMHRVLSNNGIILISLLTNNDFRKTFGMPVDKYTYIGKKNNLDHHGITYCIIEPKSEIKKLFDSMFKNIKIGYNEFYFNPKQKVCHWIIIATKRNKK